MKSCIALIKYVYGKLVYWFISVPIFVIGLSKYVRDYKRLKYGRTNVKLSDIEIDQVMLEYAVQMCGDLL